MADEVESAEHLVAGLPQGAGLAILRALGRGRRTVTEVVAATGLAQSNVSNHLARFRQRGWVEARRSGRRIYYHVADEGIAAYLERLQRASAALPPPRLLGAFDPLLLGWASREPIVGPHRRIVTAGGLFRPFALAGGRAVATWNIAGGQVVLAPFAPLDTQTQAALAADAAAVMRFLGQ